MIMPGSLRRCGASCSACTLRPCRRTWTSRDTPLRGDLRGYWAVRVSGNWRVIFRFENGNAFDVDLVDYH